MNLEWQNPNTEIPKPVEQTEQVEAEQNIEQELSPEHIEQIMAKVQDINQDGIAFSVIKTDKFENILNEGILGSYELPNSIQKTEINKSDWVKQTRKEKNSNVYFNITGRQYREHGGEMEILNSRWVKQHWTHKDHIVVLFDISKYKEEFPIDSRRVEGARYSNRTFRGADGSIMTEDNFIAGVDKSNDCEGFVLSHRVSPKHFQGIVAKFFPDEIWIEGCVNTGKHASYGYENPNFKKRLTPYLKILLANKKTDELIPIYSPHGDLCFPKQMSYEDVKKFVAERDAKNTNKEEK